MLLNALKTKNLDVIEYEKQIKTIADKKVNPQIALDVDFFVFFTLEIREVSGGLSNKITGKLTLGVKAAGSAEILSSMSNEASSEGTGNLKPNSIINIIANSGAFNLTSELNRLVKREYRKGYLYRVICSNANKEKKEKLRAVVKELQSPYYKKLAEQTSKLDIFDCSFYAKLEYANLEKFKTALGNAIAKSGLKIAKTILYSKHSALLELE